MISSLEIEPRTKEKLDNNISVKDTTSLPIESKL